MALSQELNTVQEAIIFLHRKMFDESPSPMKLQKLCYYAQGFALAEGHELFPEDFQAWQHGPVLQSLYWEYQAFKWRQIDCDVSEPKLPQLDLIENVVAAYGRYDGAALSTMTHREKPWIDARGDLPESSGSNEVISKDSMKRFFTSKLQS